jgi:hypothetical protein
MALFLAMAVLVLAGLSLAMWLPLRAARRADFIRTFAFHKGLYERLLKRRPELTLKDCQLVGRALRQFFLAYLKGGRRFVSMPSQLADDLWHEFILYTKNYEHFCRRAFGGFLHHTPAVVLGSSRDANAGLRRCWWLACREENINPRRPTRLPLLFALDAKFGVADGFRYVPDCGSVRRQSEADDRGQTYCGADLGVPAFGGGVADSASGCGGGHSGHGDHSGHGGGHSGDASGCSASGCSGSSCGGGGCGGGGGGGD